MEPLCLSATLALNSGSILFKEFCKRIRENRNPPVLPIVQPHPVAQAPPDGQVPQHGQPPLQDGQAPVAPPALQHNTTNAQLQIVNPVSPPPKHPEPPVAEPPPIPQSG